MFGYVGQSSKMDNSHIYDSYIKVIPPLKRSAEVLVKTLHFFGWRHVAMIGGGLESTWDRVDALWRTVEDPLRAGFTLTACLKFDSTKPLLVRKNIRLVSAAARGKRFIWEGQLSSLRGTQLIRVTIRGPGPRSAPHQT